MSATSTTIDTAEFKRAAAERLRDAFLEERQARTTVLFSTMSAELAIAALVDARVKLRAAWLAYYDANPPYPTDRRVDQLGM